MALTELSPDSVDPIGYKALLLKGGETLNFFLFQRPGSLYNRLGESAHQIASMAA